MRPKRMVTPSRIVKIADTLTKPVSMDHALELGVACFEEGMMEVLRHIAVQDLNQECGPIVMSKYSGEMTKVTEERYRALQQVLDGGERELLKRYDEAYRNLSGAEIEDYFIAGFIRGYRYLKNHFTFSPNYEIEEEA